MMGLVRWDGRSDSQVILRRSYKDPKQKAAPGNLMGQTQLPGSQSESKGALSHLTASATLGIAVLSGLKVERSTVQGPVF